LINITKKNKKKLINKYKKIHGGAQQLSDVEEVTAIMRFIKDYDIREISLIQEKNSLEGNIDDSPDAEFESVDQIVTEQLVNIESDAFDKKLLLDIYNNL
jgi:hypothetical protein